MIEENKQRIMGVLRRLEWSKPYSYCTGWPSCPICHGIKPGHGIYQGEAPDNTGHKEDCELKLSIEEYLND